MKTIIEPFRIKMTEPLKITTREQRVARLEAARHNVFLLDAVFADHQREQLAGGLQNRVAGIRLGGRCAANSTARHQDLPRKDNLTGTRIGPSLAVNSSTCHLLRRHPQRSSPRAPQP